MQNLAYGPKSLNPAMQHALDAGRRLARYAAPVLLIGESGVGKEWLARQIHLSSQRSTEAWTKVHCDSIDPKDFGERIQDTKGGTICLEDIDQASLAVQNTLIDRLERCWQMCEVAEEHDSPRFIATTTCKPNQLLSSRQMRRELYLLLCPASIEIPPLRCRIQDLPGLAEYFLSQSVKIMPPECQKSFSSDVMQGIADYSWPGNLDQLRSCIRRAVINSKGPELSIDIDAENSLWESFTGFQQQSLDSNQVTSMATMQNTVSQQSNAYGGESLTQQLVSLGILEADKARVPLHDHIVCQVEKELISQVLEECEQIQTKAAIRLGINRNTLHKKVKEYDLAVNANGN